MPILNINIPAIATAFYPANAVAQIKSKLATIKSKYGDIITNVSSLTNVPEQIIYSFIFIESAGQPSIVSYAGAVGLMQVTPATATNVIYHEKKNNRLLAGEEAILRKHLGTRLDCIFKFKYDNHPLACNNNTGNVVTKEDLQKAEFNVLVGALAIGQLIDLHTEGGKVRLDKIVIRYNRGMYYKPKGDTIEETIASVPKETKNYVYKLMGKNSLLEILTT